MAVKYLLDNTLKYLQDENNLYLVFTNPDATKDDLLTQMAKAIKSRTVKAIFRYYLLNYDETIKEDITDYVMDGGTLSIKYNNGKGIRRNANITLNNLDKKWNPNSTSGYLWQDSKFRIDYGVQVRDGEIWCTGGIFVVEDPDIISEQNNKTISLQLSDKFASIDGNLGGKIASSLTIALGSNIKDSMSTLLKQDRITNLPYDVKPIRFPTKYIEEKTAYTITKTDETTIGELNMEMGDMLSCDVFYDKNGYLTYEEGNYSMDISDREVIWDFNEEDLEYLGSRINIAFSKVHNIVTVIGANINGDLITYTAKNTNPKSNANINIIYPNPLVIKDDNIYSVALAKERSEYELFKQGLIPVSFNFKCTFMPHLDVNKCVTVSDSTYNFKHTPFIIQSIDIPLSQSNNDILLTMANISEVGFI